MNRVLVYVSTSEWQILYQISLIIVIMFSIHLYVRLPLIRFGIVSGVTVWVSGLSGGRFNKTSWFSYGV